MLKRTSPSLEPQHRPAKHGISLQPDLSGNLEAIRSSCGNSPDLVIREIELPDGGERKFAVIYVDGLTDAKSINHFILDPLLLAIRDLPQELAAEPNADLLQRLARSVLPVGQILEVSEMTPLLQGLLFGQAAIMADGSSRVILIGMKGGEDRGVQEPSAQTVIRGPKEGFTEDLSTNIALVRRKIRDPRLWLEEFRIGRMTHTRITVMYLKGTAKEEVIQEVRSRLERIRIDGILESGYIEELIQDRTFTPFPTMFHSERPDVIAAGLLEGRIAILVDGTPFVLLVPALFPQFFQAAEDYYQRSDIATFLRILRYISFFIALLGPSLYIAITTFHHEMLPPPLLISLIAQRGRVPFPAFIEALMMEVTFELLREAGVRLPRAVGQAVSIVGALVIGQAAVEAGIISAAMVIVVAITAISSFVIPAYNMGIAVRMLRFGLMGLAASFGLYGMIVGLILIIQHLCGLRSFGVPYMTPFSPVSLSDQKDTIARAPLWGLFSRPRFLSPQNPDREDTPPT
ncbi:spore germination protein [Cohnella sp. CFH 77786]|uniref:spore germination protein n=1 Tax=Cohnella sp. CFH 77786 TaxID=2662265 RepID=UPI002105A693|nr:spore germination protein [Cohnella sp. CFH 77786]